MLAAVVVSIIAMDLTTIHHIGAKETEGYWVQTGDTYLLETGEEEIQTSFTAASTHISGLSFWCEDLDTAADGTITYSLYAADGTAVLENRQTVLSDAADETEQRIAVDLSTAEFELGADYILTVSVETDEAITLYMDDNGIMHTQYYRVEYKGLLYGMLAVINIFVGVVFLLWWTWGWSSRLFVVLPVGVSVMALVLTAPFSREDEARHFARAYDLSLGGSEGYTAVPSEDSVGLVMLNDEGTAHLIQIPEELAQMFLVDYTGNYVQRSYYTEVNTGLCWAKLQSIFAQPEQEGLQEVSEEATYGRGLGSYWPQVIFICLARAMGMRSGLWYYMAGLGQIVFSTLFLWIAIKLMRHRQHMVWLCSFIMPVLQLRGSCNPDGIMMAEIILCIAVIFHLRESEREIPAWQNLAFLAIYFVLLYEIYKMKAPYALFCLGFVLLLKKRNFNFLPWKFISRHKREVAVGLSAVIIAAAVYVLGVRHGDLILAAVHSYLPQAHIDYILENTVVFAKMYLWKFWLLLLETKQSLHGSYYFSYGYICFFVMLFMKKRLSIPWKIWQAFLFLLVVGLIVLAGYTLTPPDYGQIWGITFRYILPAMPAAALVLPFGTERTEYCVERIYPPVFLASVMACCLAWLRM
ncbi:MAG: DUF2142 domain-containing protein [Clostridiales bacterium]|nr:DUF2142 domain-containing protein [Clostridiales bacterium]